MRLRQLIPLGLLVSSGIDECDDLMLGLGLVCMYMRERGMDMGGYGGCIGGFSLFLFSYLFIF